jgi:uncharacterized protein YggE
LLHVSIEARGATTGDALRLAAADANKVIGALPELGLSSDDVTTMGVAAHPKHDPAGGGGEFLATTNLVIAVRGPERVGETVDGLVALVGDTLRLHHVSFMASEVEGLQAVARGDAVRRARQAAEQLASAAGGRLGPLRSLHEGSVGPMRPGPALMAAGARPMPPPMPVQPGESTVRIEVVAVYEVHFD